MSILMLSDAHLHGHDDPGQHALLGFLDAVEFDELVINGDLFDVWWTDGTVPEDARPILEKLERLDRDGRKVTWVAGNHDWTPGRHGFATSDSWSCTLGSRRLLAVHGDEGVDPRRRHRLFERFIRSGTARQLGRAIGNARVREVAHSLTRRQRSYSPEKRFAELSRQNALADRLLGAQADVVFFGHTHAPGILPRRNGTLVNLGDWLHHRSFARVTETQIALFRWADGEEIPLPEGPPQRWPWATH